MKGCHPSRSKPIEASLHYTFYPSSSISFTIHIHYYNDSRIRLTDNQIWLLHLVSERIRSCTLSSDSAHQPAWTRLINFLFFRCSILPIPHTSLTTPFASPHLLSITSPLQPLRTYSLPTVSKPVDACA